MVETIEEQLQSNLYTQCAMTKGTKRDLVCHGVVTKHACMI